MGQQNSNWNIGRGTSTRRRFLSTLGTGGVGLAALGVVGCSSSNNNNGKSAAPSASAAAPAASAARPGTAAPGTARPGSPVAVASAGGVTPKKGGTLNVVMGNSGTQTLDPHTTTQLYMLWGLISNKLISPDSKTIEPFVPELVEKWEQVDPMTLNLTARQNVKFHANKLTNGRLWTAGDVAYNIQRMSGSLDPDRKAAFQRSSDFAGMDKVVAVDDKIAKVTFQNPNSQFLNGMADWPNWVVPKELVDKDPNFKDPKNFAGTGAFTIDSWDDTALNGHYVANPNYWETGLPYLAGVQGVLLADDATTQAAFFTNKIDVYQRALAPAQRDAIMKGNPTAKGVNWNHSGWEYFRFNQTKNKFGDQRIRTAMFLALDYLDIANQNYGDGFWSYTGPLVSGFPGAWTPDQVSKMSPWNPATKTQDITNAKAMMSAAGFPNGELQFTILPSFGAGQPWNNNAIRVRDQLLKIWPQMKITLGEAQDGADQIRRLTTGDYEATTYASFPGPSAVVEGAKHYTTTGGRNYSKITIPGVDEAFTKVNAEFDANKRNALLGDLQKLLVDNMFCIPLNKANEIDFRQARLQGFDDIHGPGSFASYDQFFFAKKLWINS